MSERTSYAPGTPCWVDLATPDLDAAASFYGGLFGWEIPELPNSAEMGGYRRAKKDGKRRRRGDAADAGGPAAGLEHLRLRRRRRGDRGARFRRTAAAMIAEPMDVRDLRPAWPSSPIPRAPSSGSGSRARLRRRRAGQRAGRLLLERARHPRPGAAKEFYGAVFGWDVRRGRDAGGMGTYTTSPTSARTASPACWTSRPWRARRGARPLAWSTSPSRTPTRRSRRSRAAAARSVRADRHPGRPLRRSSPTPRGAVFAVIAARARRAPSRKAP